MFKKKLMLYNMWWYNNESDETIKKLMEEYHLSLSEYLNATKGPDCILWKKDPITGIRMFPKHEILPEEKIEEYKREAIEDFFNHFYNDPERIREIVKKKYNMYGSYFYRIIGNDLSDFDYDTPIAIRKKWCLMIEKYFKKHDKEYVFMKDFTINKVNLNVSNLSIPSLKEKLNLKDDEEAQRYLEATKKEFIITSNGIRRKERDYTSYSELFIKREDKEEIYTKAIEIIKESSLNKISKTYLMKKLELGYNAVSIIMDALIERGYLEESNKIGTFNIIKTDNI